MTQQVRIEGLFGLGSPPFITCRLKCDKPHIDSITVFVVDTGAYTTSLSQIELTRLGLKHEDLIEEKEAKQKGIGGAEAQISLIFNCKIIVGGIDDILLERITVRKEDPNKASDLNLLGMDVLWRYKISFTQTQVFLER